MARFVAALRDAMHRSQPDSLVLWYDAVTDRGQLQWQNALTPRNAPFFARSDGLFTNYHWNEQLLAVSAANAGDRVAQIYAGVDVHGYLFIYLFVYEDAI